MVLLVDNYDSFTYNLLDYLEQLQVDCRIWRNDTPIDRIISDDYSALVLSPGPEKPQNSGNLMPILSYYVGKLPILGICLGHQAIGLQFGARLVKAAKPMHGKVSTITCGSSQLFRSLPAQIRVVRYHSLILTDLPRCLEIIGQTDLGEVMAIKHREYDIYGLQFHPEAYLTEGGVQMINNWVGFYNLAN